MTDLYVTCVSRFPSFSFPVPLLPAEWGRGEVAAHPQAGRISEIIPLMSCTLSVSIRLPARGIKGYIKEGNRVYPALLSLRVIRKTGGTWKAITAFQPPGPPGTFGDFCVGQGGREEEMEPFKSFAPWLIISEFPIYFISFFLSRQVLWFPLVSWRVMWQILLGSCNMIYMMTVTEIGV